MAEIVFGGGVSHTPLLAMNAQDWHEFGLSDRRNKALNLSDGRYIGYDALELEVEARYEPETTYEVFQKRAGKCQEALDRFRADMISARPDVVVIVSNDHYELFGPDNMPALGVYYGDKIPMRPDPNFHNLPSWGQDMQRGYAQDAPHVFTGHPSLARDIIDGLIDNDIDIAISSEVPSPQHRGFGHGYGFPIRRVLAEESVPVVPLMLNTYYPPNVPSAARCYTMGQQLKKAIEASKLDLRVAVLASGGLSHFVVDEALDHEALSYFMAEDSSGLKQLPRRALNSGSSEILNWVFAAGALTSLTPRWHEYQPLYRTPAGTGVGVAVAARAGLQHRSN
jgi:hypothetical protein